jgi:hypothetical protein
MAHEHVNQISNSSSPEGMNAENLWASDTSRTRTKR